MNKCSTFTILHSTTGLLFVNIVNIWCQLRCTVYWERDTRIAVDTMRAVPRYYNIYSKADCGYHTLLPIIHSLSQWF